jgi:hypothetical protein
MFSQLVKPSIKKLVNELFTGVSYILTQQEYDEMLVEDAVTRRFALDWDTIIIPYKVHLFNSRL